MKRGKMGTRASKRTKAQKQEIQQVVNLVTDKNKSKLTKLKQSILPVDDEKNNNAIVSSNELAKASMLQFIEIANKQLDRKNANLIKTDLLAIIINLEPKSSIDELNKLSVSDLNAMIRNIIYDPVRCEKRFQQSSQSLEICQNK